MEQPAAAAHLVAAPLQQQVDLNLRAGGLALRKVEWRNCMRIVSQEA